MQRTIAALALALTATSPAVAGPDLIYGRPPFTQTLSNTFPLVFGMTADDAAQALGTPLQYFGGRPGDETFLAVRNIGGGGFFPRDDRLFLQFRRGRLTGFKGDWGRNWMWR
jgi:hypothetical protein